MIGDVLGINRRNIEFILALNPREHFALVDDKLVTKALLEKHGIPSARLLGAADTFLAIGPFLDSLRGHGDFVLKPARGSGGSGIAVVTGNRDGMWKLAGGGQWDRDAQEEHAGNILYGAFSLDGAADAVFAETRIETHPDLLPFATLGLPDVRILLYMGRPVLSMLRAPTRASKGKANLHAGGFAVGVDLATGLSEGGWYRGRRIESHPETGEALRGRAVPGWNRMVEIASGLYPIFPLGYMGVDFAVDSLRGPLILELNARPGLEIQNVTGRGLRPLLGEDR